MCLSRPGRALRRHGTMVQVEVGGRTRWCSALARPEVRPGDRVLTDANLVLAVIDPADADEMEAAVAELLGGNA